MNYSNSTEDFDYSITINDSIEVIIKNKSGGIIKISSNDVNSGTFSCLKIIEHLVQKITQ